MTFPVGVDGCVHLADSGLPGSLGGAPAAIVGTAGISSNAKGIFVTTYTEGAGAFGANDAAFHLLVVC